MKNLYVVRTTTVAGIDWSDTARYNDYVSDENGKPVFCESEEEAWRLAAHEIHQVLLDQHMEETEHGKTKITRLTDVPDEDSIRDCVLQKRPFSVNKNGELYAEWDGKGNLTRGFLYGQVEDFTEYAVEEICPDRAFIYVVENFLCPRKGTPSIERLRSQKYTFAELEKAAARQKEIENDLWGKRLARPCRSRAELVLFNDMQINQEWLAANEKAFALREMHPEKTEVHLWAEPDIAYLEGWTDMGGSI